MGDTGLVAALRLEETGPGRYTARNLDGGHGVVFGGQLLAQAVAAAACESGGMRVKSMHTIFARGGSPDHPVELEVVRLSDGRTFGSVEVSIRQGPRLCTRSLVLLDHPDADLISHQDQPPPAEPPEECASSSAVHAGWDVRIVGDVDIVDPDAVGPPELLVWSRFADIPAEPWVSQALVAYASDGFLIGTAMRPHAGVGQALAHVSVSTSVITQTLTFHETFDAGDWLLLSHRSPYAGTGRSFGRADVFTRQGRLVASFAQENMIRAFTPDRKPAAGERSRY